ncbi:E3 ubiquitin-protein ligase PRT1-like [Olea europaea var. sylvestris]|uniref:E3 ubiquitin-protein ligase PRT1-like n=1 Tax=Olea europaea var. sylvestris TaxID=158386 RepID=UPI000C1D081E|nr:E3 ubiquitin-protein ligase PRT1-like [Olea europaea var. sylvestris]
MNNQGKEDYGDIGSEDFPDEFQCCVCLDIMYKPVVLACGHISCFWCVFKAMDSFRESHCPICRNPYNHFPSICRLLHFLLLKLYPSAYKRRERQVADILVLNFPPYSEVETSPLPKNGTDYENLTAGIFGFYDLTDEAWLLSIHFESAIFCCDNHAGNAP